MPNPPLYSPVFPLSKKSLKIFVDNLIKMCIVNEVVKLKAVSLHSLSLSLSLSPLSTLTAFFTLQPLSLYSFLHAFTTLHPHTHNIWKTRIILKIAK